MVVAATWWWITLGIRDIIAVPRDDLGTPLGQPPDTPQTSVGHVPEARAPSI